MMHEGDVKSALRMTSTQDKGMPMNVSDSIGDNETVFDALCQKHPEKKPLTPSAITNDSATNFHPVIFEEITGDFIRNIVLHTQGSAGPSGLDAKEWKHLCTSFQSASDSLCDAIAKLSVRLCSSIINPDGISALTASRLIALNKSPGVRPIGVGEVLRRVICKAALRITREDVRKAVGPLQPGVGYDGGCEAAVHAMSIMSSESEATLLVDATIGSDTYTRAYVTNHVRKWNTELSTLATFGKSQPHAAYSAFVHGFSSKWSFLMRTTDCDCLLYQPLEDTITNHFIPAISGRNSITEEERDLLALPIRMGGLGITNPTLTSSSQYTASKKITKPLTDHIVQQCPSVSTDIVDQQAKLKKEVINEQNKQQKVLSGNIQAKLSKPLQKCIELSKEKGASTWLSALPIKCHGFALHKSAFRDTLCLRYNWKLIHLPSNCVCGKPLSLVMPSVALMVVFPPLGTMS